MIDQQLIDMLDNPNPQVRADAVKQLARMKNQEAVQYLAAVYKTDDDAEIRELARKAGLYIKKKMTEESWTGGEGIVDDEPEPIDDEPERVEVSGRAVESSKGLMDSAMNLHVAGDDEKAMEYVEKAYMTNPNLQYDSYYSQLAGTIMGVPASQVADLILADVEFKGGKAKRKRKPRPDDVSTETVIIDLLIYWIVMAAILVIGMLIFFQAFSSAFDTAMASPDVTAQMSAEEMAEAEEQIAMFMNVFMGAGLVASIIYAVVVSVFSVIGLLIQYAFIHFSATTVLSGDGTFKGLIHKLTNFFTATYAIYAIVVYVMMFIAFQDVMSAAAAGQDPETMPGFGGIFGVIYFFAFVASIFWLYWLSKLIGKNYEFGTGKGCLTWIIANVLMSALSCACGFAFSTVIGNMLVSSMSSSGF